MEPPVAFQRLLVPAVLAEQSLSEASLPDLFLSLVVRERPGSIVFSSTSLNWSLTCVCSDGNTRSTEPCQSIIVFILPRVFYVMPQSH